MTFFVSYLALIFPSKLMVQLSPILVSKYKNRKAIIFMNIKNKNYDVDAFEYVNLHFSYSSKQPGLYHMYKKA